MMSNKDEKWLDELLSDLPKPEKTGDRDGGPAKRPFRVDHL
jgi:hypothetical protein